jgi:hypothetical protein
MNPKTIRNHNNKGQRHGYHEWYWNSGEIYYRTNYKNNLEIGYEEHHDNKITKFYIR